LSNEPTLTRAVLAGIIAGAVMLGLDRFNRAFDFFNGDELTQARTLIPVVAGVVAGLLIRSQVVPVAVHEAQVTDTALRGIALGKQLAENPPPPAPLTPSTLTFGTSGTSNPTWTTVTATSTTAKKAPAKKAAAKKPARKRQVAAKRTARKR
jgi:hypothetical protein